MFESLNGNPMLRKDGSLANEKKKKKIQELAKTSF